MAEFCILSLSVIGLVICGYFFGVRYQWLTPEPPAWLPPFLRMSAEDCTAMLASRHASLFGIPNSVYGIFFYGYLILDQFFFPAWIGSVLLALAFARSVYLTYDLVLVTERSCPLCFIVHMANLILIQFFVIFIFFGHIFRR